MQDLEAKADGVFQRNMALETQIQALVVENNKLTLMLEQCNCKIKD